MHPDFLGRELSSRQLGEWLAWYRLEPRGEERDDWRIAALAADLLNNDPMRSRRASRIDAKDLLLRFERKTQGGAGKPAPPDSSPAPRAVSPEAQKARAEHLQQVLETAFPSG